MKALQRLVVTGHWLALLWTVANIGAALHHLLTDEWRFNGGDVVLGILIIFGPLAAFVFVLWIFTGKVILWPWNRSLPKQED